MDMSKLVGDSLARLQKARRIADDLRRDERLNRLAMVAVFVLEDVHIAWRRMQDTAEKAEQEQRR